MTNTGGANVSVTRSGGRRVLPKAGDPLPGDPGLVVQVVTTTPEGAVIVVSQGTEPAP